MTITQCHTVSHKSIWVALMLRYNKNRLFTTKNILNVLICQSYFHHIYLISMIIFIYNQSPLFDQSQIKKLILKTYFKVHLKHESTTFANSVRIRMRNNKLILFKNQ